MENKAPTILIINVHSSCNAGDLALLECGLSALRAAFGNPFLKVCANWPKEAYFKQAQGFETLPSPHWLVGVDCNRSVPSQLLGMLQGLLLALWAAWVPGARFLSPPPGGWRQLINTYREADLVVTVSGNQFFSKGKFGWPFPLTWMAVWLANLYHKPLYVLPQSIGPLKRAWERQLLGRAYAQARLVCLRDQASLRLAAEIGLPAERVKYAPDPAFDYEAAPVEVARQALARYGFQPQALNVGVTLIARMTRSLDAGQVERYYTATARVLERAVQAFGARVYIFTQVSGPTQVEDDRRAARKMLAKVANPANIILVDELMPPALLKACFGQMDFFVASRLHSGIFAMGMAVPCLFVGYLSKTRGVLEAMDLADWVVDLAEADEAMLWERFSQGLQERVERAALLAGRLPAIRSEVHQVERWIRQDYDAINQ